MRKRTMTKVEMIEPSPSYTRLLLENPSKWDDPYERLADAIICFACDDLRMAISKGNERLQAELKKFFRSEWGKTLCNKINSDSLVQSITKGE